MPPFTRARFADAPSTAVFRWDGGTYRQVPDRVFVGPVDPAEGGFVPSPADIWYRTEPTVEAPAPVVEAPAADGGALGLPVPSAPAAPPSMLAPATKRP